MDNVKKLFVQALIEAENKEISKLKGEDEIEWEFSEKFEKIFTFGCQHAEPSEEACLPQL